MMRRIITLCLMAMSMTALAQKPQVIPLSDEAYQASAEYQAGNKYQKDAILFMDMVADTHPYYFKAERRAEWFAQKQALLERCRDIDTVSVFADALADILGPLRDGHTDISMAHRSVSQQAFYTNDQPGPIDPDHIMRWHSGNYDYQVFADKGICYLQFNLCIDASEKTFATFLDEMFDQMRKKRIRTLVVDVQYNPGGNSRLCEQLLQHLYPADKMKRFTTNLRLSNLLTATYPQFTETKAKWESDGHQDELYPLSGSGVPANARQSKLFDGNVIFVMGPRTYSSAGMLLTMARDNHIGTIIGTDSSFPPSHFGEVLSYRLPNTGIQGTISCKLFARPDAATVDDTCLHPDHAIDLTDKDALWQYIVETVK